LQYNGIYLFPPRPENAIAANQLDDYEHNRGFVAQVKKNGTSNVIIVDPDRAVRCYTRHNTEHKAWALTEQSGARFRTLPGNGWYVFAAELLHSKTRGIKDTNYIYDIIVNNGEYLVGSEFIDRQNMLKRIFLRRKNIKQTYSHYVLDFNTWLAVVHEHGFYDLFKTLVNPEDEGLVLKEPHSKLAFCGRPENNRGWQVKCRRPDISPNFSF
jgi:hypothetical protein